MTFFEFLLASGNEALYDKLLSLSPGNALPQTLHDKSMNLYKQFCLSENPAGPSGNLPRGFS
jgi:hypothetical protein